LLHKYPIQALSIGHLSVVPVKQGSIVFHAIALEFQRSVVATMDSIFEAKIGVIDY
jgi:hypothetical protein